MSAMGTLRSPDGVPPAVGTAWGTVLLAIVAGMLAAFQIGKVHISLPSVRLSFSLGLVAASWILSALNVVGLFTAAPAGTFCARIGNKKSVVIGLLIIAVASACGAESPTVGMLLLSRFLEGVGFVIVVVAAPSLVVEVTRASDMRLALAGWSAYMPGGVAVITVLAPFVLAQHTWRAVWWLNTALLVVVALMVMLFARKTISTQELISTLNPWEEFRTVVTARGPLLLAIIFGMYTMQHLSVMGFMPTLMKERFHLPEASIGLLVAVAMASNVIGNLAAGVLLQRGIARGRIIAFASIFMALMTLGIFAFDLKLPLFYACAFGFSCVGGLVPSAVMGSAPFHAPAPSLIGATNGLLVQGSNFGIVFGPPLMSSIAIRYGWNFVPFMTVAAAAICVALALSIRTSVHTRPEFRPDALAD